MHSLKFDIFDETYELNIAKMMHQVKLGCLPPVFNKIFMKLNNIHSYNT